MKYGTIGPVNIKTLRRLVPHWAIHPVDLAVAIDDTVSRFKAMNPQGLPERWWIEVNARVDPSTIRLVEPNGDGVDNDGQLLIDCVSPWCEKSQIIVPIGDIFLSTHPGAEHCVYLHSFGVEKMGYVGLTKRPWHERMDQHASSSRRGSNLLFHRAMRENPGKLYLHRVFLGHLDFNTAMQIEEEFISLGTLYPKGLNMIPGGFAGHKYLAQLGCSVRSAEERDSVIERLVEQEAVNGRQNPLCAARWSADQDYVNRVICGHSGRLTIEQIRSARLLSAGGETNDAIAAHLNTDEYKIRNVLSGKRYSRVA